MPIINFTVVVDQAIDKGIGLQVFQMPLLGNLAENCFSPGGECVGMSFNWREIGAAFTKIDGTVAPREFVHILKQAAMCF